jgi:hypothetical protein
MTSGKTAISLVALAASCILCPGLFAQGPLPDAPLPSAEPPAVAVAVTPAPETARHNFWDSENLALFAGSAALSGADFAVTRANLQSGGQELNPVVRVFGRSAPGLALNFGGETAGVVALSYFFHKTGHHRMERVVSVVNMGVSSAAVGYGLAHRK